MEGVRFVEIGGGHQDGAKTDQGMESGHQLGHGRHRDAACDDRADGTPDDNRTADQRQSEPVQLHHQQGRADRDGHTGHAEIIAAPGRFRARQAAQGQDEKDPGNEIEKGGEIGAH